MSRQGDDDIESNVRLVREQCFEVPKHPNLQDSWGCCMCRTLNGTQRARCRHCDHHRCDLDPKKRPS